MVRLEFLTLIRYPLAIWVLLYHLIDSSYLIWPKLSYFDKTIIVTGKLAPSVFFILSGFVITQSLVNKPSIKNFYYRRFSYVIPIFIFTSTVMAFKFELDRNEYFLNILGLTPFFLSTNWFVLNGPAWSLIIEIWFYILVPFVFKAILSIKKPRKFLFLILISQLSLPVLLNTVWNEKIVTNFIYHNPFYHVLNFLLGMFLYSNFRKQKELSMNKIFFLKLVSYGLFFCGLILTYTLKGEIYKYGTLVIPGAVALIYTYSTEQKFRISSNIYRKISSIGESAFAIYITQWLWIGIARERINGVTNLSEIYLNILFIAIFVTLLALIFNRFVLRFILNFPIQNIRLRIFSLLLISLSLLGLTMASSISTPYLTPGSIKNLDKLVLSETKLLKQSDNSFIIQSKAENLSKGDLFINSCTFFAYRLTPRTERDKFVRFKLDINGVIASSKTVFIESKIETRNIIWPDALEIYNGGSSNFKIACN
jgi:peptidoglycan/LPS O-acetylase OafA/YrhL